MDFLPILENKRALLRPLQIDDVYLLKPLALTNPGLFEFMSTVIETEHDLLKFVCQALKDRIEQKSIPVIVFDKITNTAAGSTRFGNIDHEHKRAEIGWTWIAPQFQGTGLNKAMKFLMMQHAFEVLELNRVEIKTNERNQKSRRAIESIGGQYEGLLRHHMVNHDGSPRNTVYYSILKEEWPEIKERIFGKYFSTWY